MAVEQASTITKNSYRTPSTVEVTSRMVACWLHHACSDVLHSHHVMCGIDALTTVQCALIACVPWVLNNMHVMPTSQGSGGCCALFSCCFTPRSSSKVAVGTTARKVGVVVLTRTCPAFACHDVHFHAHDLLILCMRTIADVWRLCNFHSFSKAYTFERWVPDTN